jgi:hypothetical protein
LFIASGELSGSHLGQAFLLSFLAVTARSSIRLVFEPFAGAVDLDRSIATRIQVFASTVMQFAAFAFFLREYRDCKVALALSSVFMGIAALF